MKKTDSDDEDKEDDEDKKLRNQFSFVERATQTMNNAMKVPKDQSEMTSKREVESVFESDYFGLLQSEDVQTEPPPRANFSDTVNQWIIYDAYSNYELQKELQEEVERKAAKNLLQETQNQYSIKRILTSAKVDPNEDVNKKLLRAARILERMVNQNTFNDIALGNLWVWCATRSDIHALSRRRFQILGGFV